MKTFELTEMEMKAARLLVADCLDGMGGKRPSDLDHDPYTWTDPKVLVEGGFSKHEAAGLFGSLSEKGFIDENSPKEWCVSEAGYRWMDTVW